MAKMKKTTAPKKKRVLDEPKDDNAMSGAFERNNGDYDDIEELIKGCLHRSPPDQRALQILAKQNFSALDDMMEGIDPRISARMKRLRKTLEDGVPAKPGQKMAAKKVAPKAKAKKPAPKKPTKRG